MHHRIHRSSPLFHETLDAYDEMRESFVSTEASAEEEFLADMALEALAGEEAFRWPARPWEDNGNAVDAFIDLESVCRAKVQLRAVPSCGSRCG